MAQRSAIGKAAPPPQTEPGTARGLAKQVQVRPSIFAMLWRSSPLFQVYLGFSHQASSVSNRCYPLQHPERTRFRPFWPFPGAFFSFSLFFGRRIFALVFVQVAICWLQIEVIGDSIQPGHGLLDIVQLRYLRGGVAQQFENLA